MTLHLPTHSELDIRWEALEDYQIERWEIYPASKERLQEVWAAARAALLMLPLVREGAVMRHSFTEPCEAGSKECYGCACLELLSSIAQVCCSCPNSATCIGRYEGHGEYEPSCDDCCGHGNEDGVCVRIPEVVR